MSMIGGFYIWSLIDFFKGRKNDKQARTCPICNQGFSSFKEMWIHKLSAFKKTVKRSSLTIAKQID